MLRIAPGCQDALVFDRRHAIPDPVSQPSCASGCSNHSSRPSPSDRARASGSRSPTQSCANTRERSSYPSRQAAAPRSRSVFRSTRARRQMQAEKQRILLVDDEPQVLLALEDLLGDDFAVLKTASPEEALEMVANDRDIAVVLSDQRMPQMTGDELLARIDASSDAKRILVTAFADLSAVIRAVNNGKLFAYVTKPWNPNDLVLMVQKAADHFRLTQELGARTAAAHLDSAQPRRGHRGRGSRGQHACCSIRKPRKFWAPRAPGQPARRGPGTSAYSPPTANRPCRPQSIRCCAPWPAKRPSRSRRW